MFWIKSQLRDSEGQAGMRASLELILGTTRPTRSGPLLAQASMAIPRLSLLRLKMFITDPPGNRKDESPALPSVPAPTIQSKYAAAVVLPIATSLSKLRSS